MSFGVAFPSVMAALPLASFLFGTSRPLIGCFFTESFFARPFTLAPAFPFFLAIARLRWRSSSHRSRRKQDYRSPGPPDRLGVIPTSPPALRPFHLAAVKRQSEGTPAAWNVVPGRATSQGARRLCARS